MPGTNLMSNINISALQVDNAVKIALAAVVADHAVLMGRINTQCLSTAGLAINGAGTKVAKTGAAITYLMTNGVLRQIAAATAMPALVGSVTNAKFNVFAVYVDATGTAKTAMGVEGATLAGVIYPVIPLGAANLGFIIINPTGTGPFVGGTTNLDDGTVVPNAVYVNTPAPFDPNAFASVLQ